MSKWINNCHLILKGFFFHELGIVFIFVFCFCFCQQVDFGEVFIPVGLDVPKPRVLPEFKRLAHGLRSSNISVLDAKTFYIPNLHYDGAGPDAYFWVGNGTEPNTMGIKVNCIHFLNNWPVFANCTTIRAKLVIQSLGKSSMTAHSNCFFFLDRTQKLSVLKSCKFK